eukprot:2920260-Amphidinium_carterae.1
MQARKGEEMNTQDEKRIAAEAAEEQRRNSLQSSCGDVNIELESWVGSAAYVCSASINRIQGTQKELLNVFLITDK